MLTALRITNFVLIEECTVQFGPGLNVLSGETGAGKSIVVDALNLVLGGRASSSMIREGAAEAVLEGTFRVDDDLRDVLRGMGVEPSAELRLRRVIRREGRAKLYLDDGPISLARVKTLARILVDFSSQNEHQVLLNPDSHRDILDAYGGHRALVSSMAEVSGALQAAIDERNAIVERRRLSVEREDFLRFQLAELERIDVQPGEDERLEAERKVLANAERLHAAARKAESALYAERGAVVDVLGETLRQLEDVAAIDKSMAPQVETLQSALFGVEEVARAAGAYARRIQFDPARLDRIEARLNELNAIKRKHRTDLAGIVAKRAAIIKELEAMESAEEDLEALEARIRTLWDEAWRVAARLSAARLESARRLAAETAAELRTLSMPDARFLVDISPRHRQSDEVDVERIPRRSGNDRVEFFFSANAGGVPRPLQRAASGGELSRVLLALKRVLAGAGDVGTFVFDEIDTGIGGAVAEVVGRKLHEIAARRQLLCITHLPQIAAFARRHFVVRKMRGADRTRSMLRLLSPDERIEEIARMLGGVEITRRTREHAREMIERAARTTKEQRDEEHSEGAAWHN